MSTALNSYVTYLVKKAEIIKISILQGIQNISGILDVYPELLSDKIITLTDSFRIFFLIIFSPLSMNFAATQRACWLTKGDSNISSPTWDQKALDPAHCRSGTSHRALSFVFRLRLAFFTLKHACVITLCRITMHDSMNGSCLSPCQAPLTVR